MPDLPTLQQRIDEERRCFDFAAQRRTKRLSGAEWDMFLNGPRPTQRQRSLALAATEILREERKSQYGQEAGRARLSRHEEYPYLSPSQWESRSSWQLPYEDMDNTREAIEDHHRTWLLRQHRVRNRQRAPKLGIRGKPVVTTRDMSDAHEAEVCERLGMRQSKGSGNQWHNPMDGRHSRFAQQFAFAFDGKSTFGKSISISRKMIEKARDQAGGERPMLALRFYGSERLDVDEDWIAIRLDDMEEMAEAVDPSLDTLLDLLDERLDEAIRRAPIDDEDGQRDRALAVRHAAQRLRETL